ncbi:hypothetical protein N7466_010692 [Penicillium verhagenii]|uniref:uncharacterized protein n=1 Tax=Penicillium verhagenii TaxID=1562060 RepID=UPI002544F0C2|nr:uncharacterized protein N7466_010692 [Penicillium verhagenii]KAJ5917138.1 hypothetical protein N7466_010692 [Penicillium verhagenii]
MSDLLSSRWAPSASESSHYSSTSHGLRRPRSENRIRSTKTPSPSDRNGAPQAHGLSNGILPPSEELSRFMKIVARLRWKLPFLAEGYRLATLAVSDVDGISAADVTNAEIMFKIDFHEYYALLERAIVHLLAVFNISISSVGGRGGRGGIQVRGHAAGIHRYHANVLRALEEETTPLTPVLGSGYVFELLRKAKELRNRWKGADMTEEERERDPFEMGRKIPPLASFDFNDILTGIFGGLEEAYVRAQAHVDLCRRPGEGNSETIGSESDWGFIVDAMDWEAV